MGSYVTKQVGTEKSIEKCWSCSGSGCKKCKNRGKFEVVTAFVVEQYYDDHGRRDPSLDFDSEKEISRTPVGGGCFITTATCTALGKGDDCTELQLLRRFRDTWLSTHHSEDVTTYYSIAPRVVAVIDSLPDRSKIYMKIWSGYIGPAVEAVQRGEEARAYQIYKNMVLVLKDNPEDLES